MNNEFDKIAKLRALAASTTFPAEAEAATRKADELEAALSADLRSDHVFDAERYLPTFEQAWDSVPEYLREAMMNQQPRDPIQDELRRAEFDYQDWLQEQIDKLHAIYNSPSSTEAGG